MSTRTITLRSDLAERLEAIAKQQGRSIDDVLEELLHTYAPISNVNWALAVAEGMEAAEIAWIDDANASTNSGAHFEQHLQERWEQSQSKGSSLNGDD